MARFLFVVPPLQGHTNPTVSVGHELAERGHAVAWAGEPSVVRPLLPDGATFFACPPRLPEAMEDALRHRAAGLRGAAALKFLWEDALLPLALAMEAPLDAAIDAFAPDVLVVDQQAVGGAAVARRRGLTWATSATTSAEFAEPFAAVPKVGEWVAGELVDLQRRLGVPEAVARQGDLRMSDALVLAFTSEALVGDVRAFGDHVAFVGPSTHARAETAPFPFDWLDPDRRHVLVSLGTVNQSVGERFYRVAVEAVEGLDVQAVVVAPPERLGPVPADVHVQAFVPQLALLPHLDAVVGHGGHNTTCEALAEGLPLVVAPIRDDQPVVADQAVRAGAAVRVKFARVRAESLGAAIEQALADDDLRAAAARLREELAAAGGPPVAATALESLLPS
ncbi:MAG: glycosyltransferase family 1 protein [Acidimicrobiales bacterium]|nr:glycosyltransferase family 1 protein [Acidimicrobiales bacterium]